VDHLDRQARRHAEGRVVPVEDRHLRKAEARGS
jgi:hypothetical protein